MKEKINNFIASGLIIFGMIIGLILVSIPFIAAMIGIFDIL